nr:hypothetical protein [Pandoravirus massiliensis]
MAEEKKKKERKGQGGRESRAGSAVHVGAKSLHQYWVRENIVHGTRTAVGASKHDARWRKGLPLAFAAPLYAPPFFDPLTFLFSSLFSLNFFPFPIYISPSCAGARATKHK